jgi:3-oxoacyl-[acyl-carrier-protein] synthase-3
MVEQANSVILSTGAYLPEIIVRNEDLTQFPKGSIPLIEKYTGIKARRRAPDGMLTSEMATKAAKACLEKIGFSPANVGGLILCTSTPDRGFPPTATKVQWDIGMQLGQSFAFDMNSVCSGAVFGIVLADSLIKNGACDHILVIGAEMYSRILFEKDFSTLPFFGDGAGAILLGKDLERPDAGIITSLMKSDGSKGEAAAHNGNGVMPLEDERSGYVRMDGRAIYEFALTAGSSIIREIVEEEGVSLSDISLFVTHQANSNIIQAIAKELELPADKFFINLYEYGNTAGASVPIALDEALEKNLANRGDLIVLAAFGGGLSWSASLIRY